MALAANLSAFWILIANAWMQHPVGYAIRNGRAELTDFMAVVTQPFAWSDLSPHRHRRLYPGRLFRDGDRACHLLRKQNISFFTKSFRLARLCPDLLPG